MLNHNPACFALLDLILAFILRKLPLLSLMWLLDN
jgi:hypothetical protein